MDTTAAKQKNIRYYILSIIGVAIMVLFPLLPPISTVTPVGMQILGIYLGLLFLWSTVDVIWPSFLGILLLGFTDYYTVSGLISAGWGDGTNVYIMLICIFAYFVTKSGVSDIMVQAIIGLKFAKGKPYIISFLFLSAAYIVGAVVSMTPACLIVWALFTKYAKDIGYKKSEAYPVMMIVGIAMAGLMGFSLFPFRVPGSVLVGMVEATGVTVSFVSYVLTSFCMGFGAILVYLVLVRFLFRPDVERVKADYDFGTHEAMTPYQKQVLGLTVLMIVMFIVQSAFSSTWIGQILTQLGSSGIVLVLLTVMVFLRRKDGSPFADILEATKEGVAWPVFYLLTVGMPLTYALADESLGISQMLTDFMTPLFSGKGGLILFVFLTCLLCVVMTNLMLNGTVAMIIYVIAAPFSASLGIHPGLLACCIHVASNVSIVLPPANPIAAVMHGMTDWVTPKDIYKFSIPLAAAIWLIACVVFLTIGRVLFGAV